MPDTKITALTAISTVDPAVDVLPIVDVSDTTMAASGTTKKITSNQILGAGGTATLASATITGDLTVNSNVNVGASPAFYGGKIATNGSIAIAGGNYLKLWNSTGTGVAGINAGAADTLTFSLTNAFTTAMTLNATGLGVGGSPTRKLSIVGSGNTYANINSGDNTSLVGVLFGGTSAPSNGQIIYNNTDNSMGLHTAGAVKLTIDSSGNVGIGVTPSAWTTSYNGLNIGSGGSIAAYKSANYDQLYVGSNFFENTSGAWRFINNGYATQYWHNSGSHVWRISTTSNAAGANQPLTWTQAMTLDASGNLLVGTTSNPNSSRAAVKTASVTSALSLNSVTGDTAQELFVINKFDSNSTTSQVFARFTNNNGAAGSGQINGNGANACAFGSFSDARLKENIVSLPSQLANILSLRPVEFDYKDGSGHQIGFVAQEIQEVYADTVAEQNGFLTVTGWSKTEARLVSAIKELAAKVQALEAKLA